MTQFSKRLAALPTYPMAEIPAIKRRLVQQGVDVIDVGAGDADFAPPEVAVEALAHAIRDPAMSRYAFQLGLPVFREAAAAYMKRRFGVRFDPFTELHPLLGSKEGIAHLAMALLDPGDVAIVPEPGYAVYEGGTVLAGAEPYRYALAPRTGFLLELDEIPTDVLRRAKLVYLNYPNNPTATIAPREYLERTVAFCRKHGIVIVYDNPYCEITFDGHVAPSIFEIAGARDIAVEFHSLSKTFCMTGWRLAWAAGRPELIAALGRVKNYVDTGAFLAVQAAGAAVLPQAEELAQGYVARFRERRDAMPPTERDRAREVLSRRDRGGGIIGVVQVHELGAVEHIGRDFVQLQQETRSRRQRVAIRLGTREHSPALVHGVARLGDDRHIARIEQRHREMGDPFLRSQERVQLGEGIEPHAEAPLHVGGGGLAEHRQAAAAYMKRRFGVRFDPFKIGRAHV